MSGPVISRGFYPDRADDRSGVAGHRLLYCGTEFHGLHRTQPHADTGTRATSLPFVCPRRSR